MAREAGIPNKNKKFLMNRLQDMYGDDFHPIMNMAKNAVTYQNLVDSLENDAEKAALIPEANKQWENIAQYVEPKRKAMEISGDPDQPIKHDHTIITFIGVNANSN